MTNLTKKFKNNSNLKYKNIEEINDSTFRISFKFTFDYIDFVIFISPLHNCGLMSIGNVFQFNTLNTKDIDYILYIINKHISKKKLLLCNDTVKNYKNYKDLLKEYLYCDEQYFNNPSSSTDCVNFILKMPQYE